VAFLAERLGLEPGRTVLDLAAGTGKLTRLLVPTGARMIAVEPVDEMRALLEQHVPASVVLAGTAEAIPLPDGSVEAATVAQAFHWFRVDEALRELHRVLRPGGGLAVVWNTRAPGPLSDGLAEILRPLRGDAPARAESGWRDLLESSGLFGPLEKREFAWEEHVDEELLARRVLSISFVASLPEEAQRDVADRVRAVSATLPRPLRLPQVTEVWISYSLAVPPA
jgi:SAM-dependent methyltransferase